MAPLLSVIIVNFQSSVLADACIRSLQEGTRPPDEIIVIDNDARDQPADRSSLYDLPVRWVARSENPGYSASCNDGAAAAAGDVLLFLNADVTVSSACLERCLQVLGSTPDIGVVGCRLVRPDGTFDHACHRGMPTPEASFAYKLRLHRLMPTSRRANRYLMSWLDETTEHDIEACSGAFLMIERRTLEVIGGWDERYRFYAEDLDLCLRVAETGRRIRYVGTASATHRKGAFSHNKVPDAELDPEQLFVKRRTNREIVRSHRLFFDEHMRTESSHFLRLAANLLLGLQELRVKAADRRARS